MLYAVLSLNNNPMNFDRVKLEDATAKYVKRYYNACWNLYNLGYLRSPSFFDISDMLSVLLEENPELFGKLTNDRTGELMLDSKGVYYASKFVDDDKVCEKVLKYLQEVLEAEKAIKTYESLCDGVKVPTKNRYFSSKVRVQHTNGRIISSNKLPSCSPYIYEILKDSEKGTDIKVNYNREILVCLLRSLGVSDIEISASESVHKSLILGDKFTFEDDYYLVLRLISGAIVSNTELGQALTSKREEFYSNVQEDSLVSDFLTYEISLFCNDCVKALDKYHSKPYSVVMATEDYIIYNDETAVSSNFELDEDKYWSIGTEVYNYASGIRMNVINKLLGYSGEFISAYDAKELGYEVKGVPVKLYDFRDDYGCVKIVEDDFYPLCSVYVNSTDSNPVPLIGYKVNPSFMTTKEALEKLDIDCLDNAYVEFYSYFSEKGNLSINDTEFLAKVSYALTLIYCDVSDPRFLKGYYKVSVNKRYFSMNTDDLIQLLYNVVFLFKILGF